MIIPGESRSVPYPDSEKTHALSVPTDQLSRALLPVSRHLRTFKNSASLQEGKAQILRRALTAIGERIVDVANAKTVDGADGKLWERAMWCYITYFCPQKIEWHQLRRLYTRFGLGRLKDRSVQSINPSIMNGTLPSQNTPDSLQDIRHQIHDTNATSGPTAPIVHTSNSPGTSLFEPPIAAFQGKGKEILSTDSDDDISEAIGLYSASWSDRESPLSPSDPNRARSLGEIDEIVEDPSPSRSNPQKNNARSPVKKDRPKGSRPLEYDETLEDPITHGSSSRTKKMQSSVGRIWSKGSQPPEYVEIPEKSIADGWNSQTNERQSSANKIRSRGPPREVTMIDLTGDVTDFSRSVIDLTQPIVVDLTLDDDDIAPSTPPVRPSQLTLNGPIPPLQSDAVGPPLPVAHTGATLVHKPLMQPAASTTPSTTRKPGLNQRISVDEIERHWNDRAREAGAASISFVNDIDAERVPPGTDRFRYLESSFLYGQGVPKPWEYSKDTFSYCTSPTCDMGNSHKCECQSSSDLANQAFAYTPAGRFAFRDRNEQGFRVEVIECNWQCACPKTCPNRASQRPRSVPIEIFKTLACGWGARSTATISKGQIIGFHTGKIIKRETVDDLDDTHSDYIFDIDAEEHIDGDYPKYSVDSTNCGNWTRFLNHSCEPVVDVYTAVVDCPPGVGLGRLVFVANKNIPPRTELTIDYNPGYDASISLGDSGSGGERSNNTMNMVHKACYCGMVRCRGTIM